MQDCASTTAAFTLTNIIQFGIVIKVLTPPVKCISTCIISAFMGTTLIPSFIIMDHIAHSKVRFIYKCILILSMTCIPFASAVGARVAMFRCFDENWYVWFIQGCTVPAMFWTTYKMLFGKSPIHDS